MKNHFTFSVLVSILFSSYTFSQVSLTNPVNPTEIYGSSAFLDASTNYSLEAGMPNNQGKGIVVPSVDLINFEFDLTLADGITFPTYFDGMVVYNRSTGSTLTTDNRSSTATAVTPGFYYFSNPNGAANGNVTGGVWTAVGASVAAKNVTSTEVMLNTKINGVQLYAINGSFTATGTSAAVTVTKPTGMSGYYSMVIYKDGKTFRNGINSFDTALATLNVITGSGSFSEVFPVGTYSYVLEYFK